MARERQGKWFLLLTQRPISKNNFQNSINSEWKMSSDTMNEKLSKFNKNVYDSQFFEMENEETFIKEV